jgi:hypothetical protein
MACAAFPPYGRGGGPIDSALIARALATQPTRVRVLVVGDAEAQEQRGNIEVITTAPLERLSRLAGKREASVKEAYLASA